MQLDLCLDFEWQREIVASPARIMTLMGGRGVGKTSAVARPRLIRDALANRDHRYAYFAPSYAKAMFEQKRISKDLSLRIFIIEARDQPYPYVKFCSGSQINYRSSDREDNLLGDHLDGAVIDETHKLGERLWDNIIRPQLTAKRGWAMHLGQHDDEGEDGWIHKRLELPARKPNQTRIAFWRIPSSMGYLYRGDEGAEELEYIRSTTAPMDFRRQYMAEAIECGNKAFRPEDLKNCTEGETQDRAIERRSYVIGWDLGRFVDPSAWVVLEAESRKKATVVAEGLRTLGEHHADGALEALRISRIYGNARMIVDATGGGAGGQEADPGSVIRYYKESIPNVRAITINWSMKLELVEGLRLAVEQKKLRIPAALTKLHVQLSKYRWERKGHKIYFNGPNGHEDDLVMALAMAWWGVQRGFAGTEGGAPLDSLL